MDAVEYEKGFRRGQQILRVHSYLRTERRRYFYDLGIANQNRLHRLFRTRTHEYWQGYVDGLRSKGSPESPND